MPRQYQLKPTLETKSIRIGDKLMPTVDIRPIKIIDPTGQDQGLTDLTLSPRPSSLQGKRLGLLDNSKANAEVILKAIARILDEEYEFSEVFYIKKHSASLPPHPEVLEELHRNCDMVIAGVGD